MRRGLAGRSAQAPEPLDLFHRQPSNAAGFVTNSTIQNSGQHDFGNEANTRSNGGNGIFRVRIRTGAGARKYHQ
jgi:hypothetical protein